MTTHHLIPPLCVKLSNYALAELKTVISRIDRGAIPGTDSINRYDYA